VVNADVAQDELAGRAAEVVLARLGPARLSAHAERVLLVSPERCRSDSSPSNGPRRALMVLPAVIAVGMGTVYYDDGDARVGCSRTDPKRGASSMESASRVVEETWATGSRVGREESGRATRRLIAVDAGVDEMVSYFPHSKIPVLLPTVRAERFEYFPTIGSGAPLGCYFRRICARPQESWTRRFGRCCGFFFDLPMHHGTSARVRLHRRYGVLARDEERSPRSDKAHLKLSVDVGVRAVIWNTRLTESSIAGGNGTRHGGRWRASTWATRSAACIGPGKRGHTTWRVSSWRTTIRIDCPRAPVSVG